MSGSASAGRGDQGSETDEGGTLLFCVETCDVEGVDMLDERYFATLEEAKTYAGRPSTAYRWLCEQGYYAKGKNGIERDWVYFWWSPGTSWGDPEGRGCGIPLKRTGFADYFPADPAYDPPPRRMQSRADLLK
jgi:hypothetical protein